MCTLMQMSVHFLETANISCDYTSIYIWKHNITISLYIGGNVSFQ